jgi:tetratricopeptide (TPR) repeat protein
MILSSPHQPYASHAVYSTAGIARALSFVAALLVCTALVAQEDPAAATQPGIESEAQQAREQEIAREIARREAALEELRYNAGVYSPQLQEAYHDLGAYYAEVGDFERARDTYSEALQIARINTGLYSTQQLPLIRAGIEANLKLEAWADADDLHVLHQHISSRIFVPEDKSFLSSAQLYGAWRLRVLRENLLDHSFRGLVLTAEELSDYYAEVILKIEATDTASATDIMQLLFSKIETDLVLVRAIATTPYTEFAGTVSPYIYQSRCRNVRDANGQVSQRCTNIQVQNPRYGQSQRDAKQLAVSRQARSLTETSERLTLLRDGENELNEAQRQELTSRIAQLDVETQQLLRRARSRSLF